METPEEKKYTLEELKKKLTDKESIWCHEYIIDWNKARAAREAGYSEDSAADIGYQNSIKLYIKQYVDFIKNDFEKEAGISKLKQIKEYQKIAYSSISHLHNTWIELKEFETLTNEQKECIESIETKHETKQIFNIEKEEKEDIHVNYVKIKLYSKLTALERIDKMMGYNEPEKIDHSSKDGSMKPVIQLNYKGKDINLSTDE